MPRCDGQIVSHFPCDVYSPFFPRFVWHFQDDDAIIKVTVGADLSTSGRSGTNPICMSNRLKSRDGKLDDGSALIVRSNGHGKLLIILNYAISYG